MIGLSLRGAKRRSNLDLLGTSSARLLRCARNDNLEMALPKRMLMDIAEWLRGLGLEQYENAFRENAIDVEVLRDLTADDIKELGVTPIGHRRRLLTAITALRGDTPQGVGETEPAAVAISGEAERRQLTVMFCDLVGSTPLSARFDPEDLREIIGAYHRCVAETVGRFDGFVAKYMGDGVLVYFGYPEAHEDDAERAVRAGLAVDRRGRPESTAPEPCACGSASPPGSSWSAI